MTDVDGCVAMTYCSASGARFDDSRSDVFVDQGVLFVVAYGHTRCQSGDRCYTSLHFDAECCRQIDIDTFHLDFCEDVTIPTLECDALTVNGTPLQDLQVENAVVQIIWWNTIPQSLQRRPEAKNRYRISTSTYTTRAEEKCTVRIEQLDDEGREKSRRCSAGIVEQNGISF